MASLCSSKSDELLILCKYQTLRLIEFDHSVIINVWLIEEEARFMNKTFNLTQNLVVSMKIRLAASEEVL